MKRHNLVHFVSKSACFFKKTNFAILKFIYLQFQTPNKQMVVFFKTRLGKNLIWQIFS